MIILRVIGLLYLLSGLFCAFNLETSAEFLGFSFLNSEGKAEYFSVYGGLQIGFGMAMILASMQSRYIEAALFFSMIISVGLLTLRIISLLTIAISQALVFMGLLETVLALVLFVGLTKSKRQGAVY